MCALGQLAVQKHHLTVALVLLPGSEESPVLNVWFTSNSLSLSENLTQYIQLFCSLA